MPEKSFLRRVRLTPAAFACLSPLNWRFAAMRQKICFCAPRSLKPVTKQCHRFNKSWLISKSFSSWWAIPAVTTKGHGRFQCHSATTWPRCSARDEGSRNTPNASCPITKCSMSAVTLCLVIKALCSKCKVFAWDCSFAKMRGLHSLLRMPKTQALNSWWC